MTLASTMVNEKGEVLDKEGNVVGYAASRPVEAHKPGRWPATTADLMDYSRDFFEECREIAYQRNQRYAGAYDPFRNFRMGGDYGIAIRMSDKVSRLMTLLHPSNTVDAADESIEDTLRDLANYAMLCAALRRNEMGTRANQTTAPTNVRLHEDSPTR